MRGEEIQLREGWCVTPPSHYVAGGECDRALGLFWPDPAPWLLQQTGETTVFLHFPGLKTYSVTAVSVRTVSGSLVCSYFVHSFVQ